MTALKIASSEPDPTAEIRRVTPAVAERWLARNVRNRPVRPYTVAAYARDMAAGHWQLNGEAIKFSVDGALIDGQHRLHAIVKSGATVPLLVVRGVRPESQATMDAGAKRSVSDTLGFDGRSNAHILAAAARLALADPGSGFVTEGRRQATNPEVLEFVEAYASRLVPAAQMAAHLRKSIDAPASVLCISWMRLSDIDADAATKFFDGLVNFSTDGPGDPRLALIKRLQTARRHAEQLKQPVYVSLIYRAWNAWRLGRRLQSLPTHKNGEAVRAPERLR